MRHLYVGMTQFRALAEEDLHAGAIARRTTSSSALG